MNQLKGQLNLNISNSQHPSNIQQVEQQRIDQTQDQEIQPLRAEGQQYQQENNQQKRDQNAEQQKDKVDYKKSIYIPPSHIKTGLSEQFFAKVRNPAYFQIHKKEKQNKKCCQACCLPIGSHTFCCGTENTKQDIKQFGMGINLYFRFLKKLGHFFIIFTILSIPQLFFSVLAYVGSESRDSSNSFEFLMATTIGATSLNNKDCQIQVFSVSEYPDDYIKFNLQCDSGNLAGSSFSYGIINSNEQDCIYLGKSELNLNTTNQDQLNSLRQQINSKEEFSLILRKSDFVNEDPTGKRIYAGAYCKESTITIGSLELKQKIVPIIFASCDAVIVLLFIYFLISLTASENKYSKISQKETPTLQHFSIQLSRLPKIEKLIKASKTKDEFKKKTDLLLFEVKQFINEQLKLALNDQQLSIYDIQISKNEELLQFQINLKQKKVKIQELLDQLEAIKPDKFKEVLENVKQENENLTLTLYEQFYTQFKNRVQLPNAEQKMDQLNLLIVKYWKEIDEITQKIDNIQLDENSKYIWVTFDTINQKEKVQKKLQSLPKDWLYYYTCLKCFDDREEQEKFLLKKFKLQVKDAPIPENINWKNLNYSMKQRFVRQLFSMLFTLILLACSWVLVSWVNLQKSDFQQKYPSINCNNKIYDNITIEQIQQEIDNNNNSAIKGYVECYCKPKFSEIIQGEYEICQDWSKQYTFQQSLPWIIVAGLIAINVLIQYILIFLSKWEGHLMISQEYSSRILKIFLAQFLNTGLILLISNIDFGNSTRKDAPKTIRFLFGGKYGDIDSKWCQNIGIVLLLTLLINILTQPIMLVVEIIIRYVRKAYDQCSCCLNEKKTRQQNYADFKDLYKGEEFRVELRYAQILTALYICFMYSPALPFLYFITMLTIWFLYYVDIISIFNTYRKPIRIDSIISESVRKYLWIAVVIHLGFATYIFGSSNLFYETVEAKIVIDQIQDVYGQENVAMEWWDRSLSQIPNIILLVILALIVILIILFFCCYKPIVGLFSKCFACCNEEFLKNNPGLDQQEQRPLLKFLKKEQIVEDLKFTQYQKEENPKIYDEKYLKLQTEKKLLDNNEDKVISQINQENRRDQSQNISKLSFVNNNGNQDQIVQIDNNHSNQKVDAENQVNNQVQDKNHQKLIGLRSFNKAYNKTYQQYYEWDFIRSINVNL